MQETQQTQVRFLGLEEGNGNPPHYSCLGSLMDRGAWWATARGVSKESDTSERTHRAAEGIKYMCLLSQVTAAAKSLQSCPSLCDPIDGSPPGSAIPGILRLT